MVQAWLRAFPRRLPAVLLFLPLVIPVLAGCGGGPARPWPNGKPTGRAATGQVVLPAGCQLPLADLQVVGCLGTSGVETDGAFTLQMQAGGPAQVCLCDAHNRLMLYGFVDADDPSTGEISPLMTAVALLYRATGLCLVPPDYRADIIRLLSQSAEAQAAAAVIAERVAANPTAMFDGDAAIVAAIEAARNELYSAAGVSPTSFLESATPASVNAFGLAVEPAAVSNIFIDDNGTESGLQIVHNPSGPGIKIVNHYRRHTWYMIYRTAHDDDEGRQTELEPWELETEGYLSATGSLGNPIGALIDIIGGLVTDSFPWAPNETAPIALPVKPTDAATTYYQIVVAGPSFMVGDDRPLDYPDGTPHAGHWDTMFEVMTAVTFVKDILLPVIGTFVPSQAIGSGMNISDEDVQDLAGDVVKLVMSIGADVAVNYASGNWKGVAVAVVKQVASNQAFRTALLQLLAEKGLIYLSTHMVLTEIAENAAVPIVVVDKLLTAADLSLVTGHAVASYPYSLWPAHANSASVRIEPAQAEVRAGGKETFTSYKSDVGAASYIYRWETLGQAGYLEGQHDIGDTIESTQDWYITYVGDADAEEGDTDTILLEITAVMPDGSQESMGTAEAQVVINATDYTFWITPENKELKKYDKETFRVRNSPPRTPGTVFYYEWNCTGLYGTLEDEDGNPAPFTSTSSAARYEAAEKSGTDGISVKVFDGDPARDDVVGQAFVPVIVKEGITISLRKVRWGPFWHKDWNGWKYGAGCSALAIWKGREGYSVNAVVHRPPEKFGSYKTVLDRDEQFTKQDLIDKHTVNIWGLADDEVAVPFAQYRCGCYNSDEEAARACFEHSYSDWGCTEAVNYQSANYTLEILDEGVVD